MIAIGRKTKARNEPARDALSMVIKRDSLLILEGASARDAKHPTAQIVASTMDPTTTSAMEVCSVAELTITLPPLCIPGLPPIPLFLDSKASLDYLQT